MGKLVQFDAEYGRTGAIWVAMATCHNCHEEWNCLLIDSSEDEYGPGAICIRCANELFKLALAEK